MALSSASPTLPARLHPIAAVRALPVTLAAAAMALQIAYPRIDPGGGRDRLTVAIVLTFAAASVVHALVWRGARFAAALLAITGLGGLAIEVIGVTTGVPFGEYRYADSLGTQLLGVPIVVALAWTMMAYPAYAVSQVIGGSPLRRAIVGGWALAAWDLFLDPQMVQAGHWMWQSSGPALAGIPVSNYVAWFVVASGMMLTLRGLTPAEHQQIIADDRVPLALYVWTFASSVLAHAAYFDLPVSAVAGGLGMGVVVVGLVRAQR